jgi:hypothetical protein
MAKTIRISFDGETSEFEIKVRKTIPEHGKQKVHSPKAKQLNRQQAKIELRKFYV